MGNYLKMEKQQQIKALLQLGWSYRAIEREIGVRRETISKYDFRKNIKSKPAKVPTGDESNAANCPPISRSSAAKFDSEIKEGLKKGYTAQRIYQDLITDLKAQISYDAVKRYTRKIKAKQPNVYARVHKLPGEEVQVDFGRGAPTQKDGKYHRPWLFKMTLSCSRHSYEEVVWHQDVETFIRCHERAFQSFGGAPKTIRLDNLKSGVLKAHLYEPELNPVYLSFSQHYNFIPLPCLPGKPEHKGKVESGIKYTQNNALKGRKFNSLDEQNGYLKRWNRSWACTRIHGTTKTQVWKMFLEEKPCLQSLPEKEFEYFKIGCRTVHADGHIEVAKSYYSVPYRYLGKRVIVHFNSKWVKVFVTVNNVQTIVACHRRITKGRFQTIKSHLPENKTFTNASYTKYLIEKCSQIGQSCRNWAEKVLKDRGPRAFRPIQGIISLKKKYGAAVLNRALQKAMLIDSFRYHTVKSFCEQISGADKPEPELIQSHEVIRQALEYQQYLDFIYEGDD